MKNTGKLHKDYQVPKRYLRTYLDQARSSFQCFMEYCYLNIPEELCEWQSFHCEWCDALEEYNNQDVLILAPGGHGKTTFASLYTAWMIGNNPNMRIKFVVENNPIAMNRCRVIKKLLTCQAFKEVFPFLEIDTNCGDPDKTLFVKRDVCGPDPSISFCGILSNPQSSRVDLLIADSVVSQRNCANGILPKVIDAWGNDFINLLGMDSRVVYLGNVLDLEDLSSKLVTSDKYEVLSYSIDDDMGSLWPSVYPESFLRVKRNCMSKEAWSRYANNLAKELDHCEQS